MKKKYINPAMEIVKIETQQVIAGSPDLGGEYNGGIPESRFFDYDEDE